MKIAVLDIGGTSIKSALYEDGALSQIKETETNAGLGGQYVMENAAAILASYEDFDKIGISTAGQVDPVKGIIRYANANIPGYTGMEIRSIISDRFHVPVAVENDVNCAAIGEACFGAGRAYNDFLCLTYGTGIGGAIVIGKKIYGGSRFSAGEFGGIILHPEDRNPNSDAFSGCYEKYASTTALVRQAQKLDPALNSGRAVFKRLLEPDVQQVVDNWILEIVYGLTTLTHIFNPSCIILGGGVMGQQYILDKIRRLLYNNIMDSFRSLDIKQAALGNTAGLLGAAKLAHEDKST